MYYLLSIYLIPMFILWIIAISVMVSQKFALFVECITPLDLGIIGILSLIPIINIFSAQAMINRMIDKKRL